MSGVTHVGRYYLGRELVDLYCDPSHGGGYLSLHDEKSHIHKRDTGHGRIVVGLEGCRRWREVMEVLEHEVYEYAMIRQGVRFEPDDRDNEDSGRYVFYMTHAQFATVVQWATWFVCPAMPDLCGHWKKHEALQRKRRRK